MTLIPARWVVRWLAAAVVCLAVSGTASAFFFRGWPGAGLPKPPTLVKPGSPPDTRGTVSQPPGFGSEPQPGERSGPSGGGPVVPETPEAPEPGTAVLAALGVGVVALARRRLRIGPPAGGDPREPGERPA